MKEAVARFSRAAALVVAAIFFARTSNPRGLSARGRVQLEQRNCDNSLNRKERKERKERQE